MPTAYTHDVQTGKVTSFREFALSCARAFGACITMRDEPADKPIPDEFEADTSYYDQAIHRAMTTLQEAKLLSDDECEKRAEAEYQDAVKAHEKRSREREAERLRYKQMLEQVDTWIPPTPDHTELKSFMQKQLRESIDFDCNHREWDKRPERETGKEWRRRTIEQAERELERNRKRRQEEIERAKSRSRWVNDLRKSLPVENDSNGETND